MTTTYEEPYELPPCPECKDRSGVFETQDDDGTHWCMLCGTTF